MGGDPSARKPRPVLIHTLRGSVEGCLDVNPEVRTLDFINVPSRFVTVDATDIAVADWSFEPGRLAINKDLIVFVTELTGEAPATDRRAEAAHFTREGISLRVADCDVKGYMHVRGVQDPLMWLSRSRQTFLALTSVSVVGPDFELATGFLAVNRAHILAVQTMALDEGDPQAEPAWTPEAGTDRPAAS
jgi:hypothetical protein